MYKNDKKKFETNTCQQFLVIRAGPWGHRSFRTAELTPVPGSGSNRTSSYPHTRSLLGGEALRGTPPGQGQQLTHCWVPGSFVIQCRCSRDICEFSLLILEAGWLHLERLSLHNERTLGLRGHPPPRHLSQQCHPRRAASLEGALDGSPAAGYLARAPAQPPPAPHTYPPLRPRQFSAPPQIPIAQLSFFCSHKAIERCILSGKQDRALFPKAVGSAGTSFNSSRGKPRPQWRPLSIQL